MGDKEVHEDVIHPPSGSSSNSESKSKRGEVAAEAIFNSGLGLGEWDWL